MSTTIFVAVGIFVMLLILRKWSLEEVARNLEIEREIREKYGREPVGPDEIGPTVGHRWVPRLRQMKAFWRFVLSVDIIISLIVIYVRYRFKGWN